jgi:hypothetical protein
MFRAGYAKLANRQADFLPSLFLIRTYGAQRVFCSARPAGFRRHIELKEKIKMNDHKNPTRKHGLHFRVPVLPDEEKQIKEQARTAGLKVAAYLRNLGLGYEVRSVLDLQSVDELAKVNADLGRLGGLLKLWLTNDERLSIFGPDKTKQLIMAVLKKIEDNQENLREIMKTAVRGR